MAALAVFGLEETMLAELCAQTGRLAKVSRACLGVGRLDAFRAGWPARALAGRLKRGLKWELGQRWKAWSS